MKKGHLIAFLSLMILNTSLNAKLSIELFTVTDKKSSVGNVVFEDTDYGLLITPNFHSLKPGLHGFHLHENPSCDQQGQAAGDHFDPQKTNKHLGPYNVNGHLGDLPALYVNEQGKATLVILAPRLTVEDIKGAIVIHEGGDNYADSPESLGGGGKRIACGVNT